MKVGSIVTPLFAFCEYNIGFVAVAAQMVVVTVVVVPWWWCRGGGCHVVAVMK